MRSLARRATIAALLLPAAAGCDLGLRPRPKPAAPAPATPAVRPPAPDAPLSPAWWNAIEDRSGRMLAARQYGGDLRFLDDQIRAFPAGRERLELMKAAVLDAAKADFQAVDARGRKLRADRDFHGAIAAWEEERTFEIPEYDALAREELRQTKIARQLGAHDAALPQLGPVLLELQGHLRARRWKEGAAMLKDAEGRWPELKPELQWLGGTLGEAPMVYGCVANGMFKMKGQSVEIRGAKATVTEVTGEEVTFTPEKGDAFAVALIDLPTDLFLKAGVTGGTTADYVGQFFLFTGRPGEARAAWKNSAIRENLDWIADRVEEAIAGGKK